MATLDARERLWVALSELFRDTELRPQDYEHIATAVREAGLDTDAAERVLLREVAPVFGRNLLAVTGNWKGWSDETVVQAVRAHLGARRGMAGRLRAALGLATWRDAIYRRLLRSDWQQVRQRLGGAAAR
jgi:hypothetical protein